MSREIKFRAWDGHKMTNEFSIWSDGTIASRLSSFTGDDLPLILMQNTGLKDRNSKEIYEGDIVKVISDMPYNEEVVWDNERAGFWPFMLNPSEEYVNGEDVVVIGNKYENSELLSVTSEK